MDPNRATCVKREITSQEEDLAIVPVQTPAIIQALASPEAASPQARSQQDSCLRSSSEVISYARALMPVNIKQILDAWVVRKPGLIVINNTATPSVKVIGNLKKRQTDEYKGFFKIQDCTGSIDASIWFTCGRVELDSIPDGAYVSALGRIRLDGPTPEIQCYGCRVVTNFNDITHHHLSAIAVHIDLVVKPAKTVHERVAEMWKEDMERKKLAKANANSSPPAVDAPNQGENGPTAGENDPDKTSVVLPHKDAVMRILRQLAPSHGPTGVHIDEICAELFSGEDQTRNALEELAEAGDVYTTIDCDHYMET